MDKSKDIGWTYYNSAVVPTTAPHEKVDLSKLEDGSLWRMFPKALFARWTEDYDCEEQTSWWYIVKDYPYVFEELSKHARKHIRRALENCYVIRIDPKEYTEELYNCYKLAYENYKTPDNGVSKDDFIDGILRSSNDTREYWGSFLKETDEMIGWMSAVPKESHVDFISAKFIPQYLDKGVSAALYHEMLSYYLDENSGGRFRYACSGSRSINHVTNTQEYKIQKFSYRKAYCRLCIKYRPWVKLAVKMLWPFRKLLARIADKNVRIHQIYAVLKMEAIVRGKDE